MIRFSSLFWIALVALTGFGMFKVKYAVQELEDELGRVKKQTVAEQQEIRVLNAEWSYLTQPERLADLNRRFVSLAPIATKQFQQNVQDIPLRPRAPEDALLTAAGDSTAATAAAVPLDQASIRPAVVEAAAAQPAPVVQAPLTQHPAAAASVAATQVSAAPTAIKPAVAKAAALVKASTGKAPRSLDELFAQINEGR